MIWKLLQDSVEYHKETSQRLFSVLQLHIEFILTADEKAFLS